MRNLYQEFSGYTDKVRESDSMEKVIKVLFKNKATRTVFVVDKKGNLRGVISLKEIFKIIGKDQQSLFSFMKKPKEFTARDVMASPTVVHLEDDLEDALTVAIKFKMQDIPVCKKGKLIGELDCFELIYGLSSSFLE
ncbi:MAG: CBS domain-containing protein [archaeon]|nr:CBS domain-containing protein [archaeon]